MSASSSLPCVTSWGLLISCRTLQDCLMHQLAGTFVTTDYFFEYMHVSTTHKFCFSWATFCSFKYVIHIHFLERGPFVASSYFASATEVGKSVTHSPKSRVHYVRSAHVLIEKSVTINYQKCNNFCNILLSWFANWSEIVLA